MDRYTVLEKFGAGSCAAAYLVARRGGVSERRFVLKRLEAASAAERELRGGVAPRPRRPPRA